MDLKQKIDQLSDQCVKCGMCLPVCPTYQISKNENESPRGRIALMQGIVKGELNLSTKVAQHLDHCVGCLSCENICPSTVQYDTLIDSIREISATEQSSNVGSIISFFLRPTVKHSLFTLLRVYQSSRLQWLARKLGLLTLLGLKEKDQLLPQLSSRLQLKPHYSTTHTPALGTVALFTGCLGHLFEQASIQATIKVLNALGYHVDIPAQVCCGALHQHSGFPKQAKQLATQNRQAFLSATPYAAILFTASGCGSQLKRSVKQNPSAAQSVMQFVYEHAEQNSLSLKPINKHVAVHQPCSLTNALHEELAVTELLSRIPELQITLLKTQCCGAAGKNMLTQADLAQKIRQPLLQQIEQASPNLVISSNIGCALHLKSGISNDLPLKHPIELLAESLM